MTDRLIPGVLAVGLGTVLVLAVLVPIVALSYRRSGRFGRRELLVAAAVPVYGLAVLGYVLLPVPEVDAAFCLTHQAVARPQTTALQFLDDIRDNQAGTGVRAALANPAVQQVVLNIVLFVPLGWLLRGPGRRSIALAGVAGFAVSLLVELTQLTGNWFLFPCPYRIADVDDLILNTTGALVGAIAVAVLRRGAREELDPQRPRPVTAGRRVLGAACDLLAVGTAGGVLGVGYVAVTLLAGVPGGVGAPGWYVPVRDLVSFWAPAVVLLGVLPVLGSGGTAGQRAVRLRPATEYGGVPARRVRLLRTLFGTGGAVLLVGPAGGLGLLGAVWIVIGFIGLLRSRGHRGVGGQITGTMIVDARIRPGEPVPVPPVPDLDRRP